MSTKTQYNPQPELNARLLAAGASKTVYALVTPEIEEIKRAAFGLFIPQQNEYFEQFRDAWTGKQDAYHEDFFTQWVEWSSPVVDMDRDNFPFYYPTAGASEALRQIIFAQAAGCTPTPRIHVFEGEYEGFKAMSEAAYMGVVEHRRDDWREIVSRQGRDKFDRDIDLFFISQPSAIDGMVWADFNAFIAAMPTNSVIVDLTYVGAVPQTAIRERFNLNAPSVRNIVFSLSKPFGTYYDRIGGVFSREEDKGLFGNKWFKNLTSLRIGTKLMQSFGVFDFPERYAGEQKVSARNVSIRLGIDFIPCDVFILAWSSHYPDNDAALTGYLTRAGRMRLCLTPMMASRIGTSGKIA